MRIDIYTKDEYVIIITGCHIIMPWDFGKRIKIAKGLSMFKYKEEPYNDGRGAHYKLNFSVRRKALIDCQVIYKNIFDLMHREYFRQCK